ncbi:amidohydrolase family protein [Psychrobium sp. 1_MG-2023]|uniref:amidohydrolase family protein n=1 Tax=Psychrobium sp. 1_MG-2023 TaxID=3062624 RepID=UPI0027349601|nr:amidohydrolase family protein [Psychrobium sp. 1_MG-2023]MDP2560517.1 amidohydrolase family protein [Psychrobium sp. 1_MG-2023]
MNFRLAKPLIVAGLSLALSSQALAKETTDKKEWDVNSPQGVFETININVSEGTWMNVDVSPNGKEIVFDLLGDIYKMSIKGGEAIPLAKGIAWNMQPKFSPDGRHIAFTSDQGGGDNIWIMNSDGSNQRAVTKETFRLLNSPAWSPDGNYIVARKHFTSSRSLGAGEVWMYHKTGGSGVKLTKRPNDQKDLGEPAFSPDGKYVYFSQDATPGKTFHYSKDSVKGIYKIKRLDRESGEIKTIISGMGGAIRPTPSPDGKKLAYISRDDFQSSIYIYDLETGEHTKVYGKLDRDMQETWAIHGVYPTIDWTPNNKSLVFWAGGKINKLDLKKSDSKVIPFSITTTKQVQQALRFKQNIEQSEFDVKMLRNVQVSPNGEKVIYEALGKLWVKSLPNGKPKRLTKQDDNFELNPQWSRDGKKIVYATWNDKEQGSLRVVSSRSGKGRTITTEPGKYVEPTFSPDGKTVVFRKAGSGRILPRTWSLNTGLYQVAVNDGEPKLITESGFMPQFGADNDRVFFMAYGKNQQFHSIKLDGSQKHKHYESKLATEFKISPDGEYVAFAERFKVYVTPFTPTVEPLTIAPSAKNLPVKELSKRAGENISWTQDNQNLYWSLGPELYSHNVGKLFELSASTEDKPTVMPTEDGINIGFTQKVDVPRGTIAFVGGQVITMKGEQVIKNGTVIVEGNVIKAVGSANVIDVPKNAKVIDLKGKSVMPGLIDVHHHSSQGSNEIIPQQNWANYAELTFGVTTTHDPSNDTTEIFAASELQKAGEIVGPRLFSTGTIVYGAHGAGYTSHVDSLDDAKFHIERLKKVGAFSIKSYNQPRRNQRQQLVEAARQLEMMVVPEGGSLLQHNLSMVADGHTGIEHSIPPAKIYDDIKQLWSQTDVGYTPTLVVAYGGIWGENYWYDKTDVWTNQKLNSFVPGDVFKPRSMRRPKAPDHHYNHISSAAVAKELRDLGVKANIGAHGQREGLGAHWEMWMFEQGGMSPLEAIRTATIDPAHYIGMDHAIGSIEQGKLADIIVIDGNPLEDIRVTEKVIYTMVNGRLYNANTMNEVGHANKKRQPFFFEEK